MATIGTLIVCGLIVGVVLLVKNKHKLPDLSGTASSVKGWFKRKPSDPNTKKATFWETVWTGEGKLATWIPVTTGIVMSYFLFWWLQPTIVMSLVARHWKELIIVHVFAVIVISMNPPNKAWKIRIAKLVAVELVIFSLFTLDLAPWLAEKPMTRNTRGETNTTAPVNPEASEIHGSIPLPSKKENEKTVREFWKKHLEPAQAEQMIAKAETESNFNQFETSKFPLRGRRNRDNIGVMQIPERWWGQVARKIGYNITTLQGNLDMALWMYHRDGERAWKIDPLNHKNGVWNVFDYRMSAPPVPDWSDRVPVWSNTILNPPGPVSFLDQHGKRYEYSGTGKEMLPLTDWITYQSKGEVMNIHITASTK
jgi:hypothetical protein